jgi:hypothetical protein
MATIIRRGPKKKKTAEKKVQVYFMVKGKHKTSFVSHVKELLKTNFENN